MNKGYVSCQIQMAHKDNQPYVSIEFYFLYFQYIPSKRFNQYCFYWHIETVAVNILHSYFNVLLCSVISDLDGDLFVCLIMRFSL